MIERRFGADWLWEPKMITWRKFQRQNQHVNRVFIHDCKKVNNINYLKDACSVHCDIHFVYCSLCSGMNLQLCFVNDAASIAEVESPSSDSESCPKLSKPVTHINQSTNSRLNASTVQPNPYSSRPLSMKKSSSHEKGAYGRQTL